jgi:hypothetical protein
MDEWCICKNYFLVFLSFAPKHIIHLQILVTKEANKQKKKQNLPYKIFAMRTECWLLEESWDESMILHIVNILLFESTFSISLPYM